MDHLENHVSLGVIIRKKYLSSKWSSFLSDLRKHNEMIDARKLIIYKYITELHAGWNYRDIPYSYVSVFSNKELSLV